VPDWFSYVLLSPFPVSVYWAMRRFGFARLPSAFGALACLLITTNGLSGFDFNSYVWRGYGLSTHLWGMVLLPPPWRKAHGPKDRQGLLPGRSAVGGHAALALGAGLYRPG
jgi:hypothetical protein